MIGNAVEVVVALDGQAIEVEMSCHAADAVISLEHNGTVPIPHQLISRREAHGACTKHCNALIVRHQNSNTTLL
ncbi:hypothetical protein D3C81_1418390 [compost metagenome]